MHTRIEREIRVVGRMILIYCQENHKGTDMCQSCQELNDYAFKRLINCPFAKDKPVCSKCKIHCYNNNQRERIKEIMRYSGSKMLIKYPKDTILYFYSKLKHKNPVIDENSKPN